MTPEERAKAIYMAYPEMVDMDGEEFMKYAASHIRAAEHAALDRAAALVRHEAGGELAAKVLALKDTHRSTHE